MKGKKGFLCFFIIAFFALLLFVLFKTYSSVKTAESYVRFITDSANSVIGSVDSINSELNDLNYNSKDESELSSIKSYEDLLNGIKQDYATKESPYEGEKVEKKFKEFLAVAERIKEDLNELDNGLKEGISRSEFEEKLGKYISDSEELEVVSRELQSEITTYSEQSSKIDFNRIINEIKSF